MGWTRAVPHGGFCRRPEPVRRTVCACPGSVRCLRLFLRLVRDLIRDHVQRMRRAPVGRVDEKAESSTRREAPETGRICCALRLAPSPALRAPSPRRGEGEIGRAFSMSAASSVGGRPRPDGERVGVRGPRVPDSDAVGRMDSAGKQRYSLGGFFIGPSVGSELACDARSGRASRVPRAMPGCFEARPVRFALKGRVRDARTRWRTPSRVNRELPRRETIPVRPCRCQ
jgi:hypothetical protein